MHSIIFLVYTQNIICTLLSIRILVYFFYPYILIELNARSTTFRRERLLLHDVRTSTGFLAHFTHPRADYLSLSTALPINLNHVPFFIPCFQAVRHEMRRLPARNKSAGSCEESEGQGFPPELFHLPGVSEADEHRRGALCPGRQQVRLQAGLPVRQTAAGHASCTRPSR